MDKHVNVNGIRVPIIRNMSRAAQKLKDIIHGSVIIISHDCIVSYEAREYLESVGVKIIRLDKNNKL